MKFSFGLGLFFMTLTSCAHHYPEHWWSHYSKESAPIWEVLPDAALPGELILSKRNELGILSNFAHTPFNYQGQHYESVEGFWQMMLYPEGKDDPRFSPKVKWLHTRAEVSQMTAFEAKEAGIAAEENMKKLKIDWVSFNLERFPYRSEKPGRHAQLIRDVMLAKLNQNPEVRRILLLTGQLKLRPDHHSEENAPQEWRYYEIWMEFRSQLQKGEF